MHRLEVSLARIQSAQRGGTSHQVHLGPLLKPDGTLERVGMGGGPGRFLADPRRETDNTLREKEGGWEGRSRRHQY